MVCGSQIGHHRHQAPALNIRHTKGPNLNHGRVGGCTHGMIRIREEPSEPPSGLRTRWFIGKKCQAAYHPALFIEVVVRAALAIGGRWCSCLDNLHSDHPGILLVVDLPPFRGKNEPATGRAEFPAVHEDHQRPTVIAGRVRDLVNWLRRVYAVR